MNVSEDTILFDFTRTKPYSIDLAAVYSCIEKVKNGNFVSTKYDSKTILTAVPHVVIFANFLPNLGSLSFDRWTIGRITKTKDLHLMENEELNALCKDFNLWNGKKLILRKKELYRKARELYQIDLQNGDLCFIEENIKDQDDRERNAFLMLNEKQQKYWLKLAKEYKTNPTVEALEMGKYMPNTLFIERYGA